VYLFILIVSALNLSYSVNIFIPFVHKNENKQKNDCILERIMLGYSLIWSYKIVHFFIARYLFSLLFFRVGIVPKCHNTPLKR